MTYALADLNLLKPIGARRDTANVVTGPGHDPLTPSQRAAVERKRVAQDAEDMRRFIRATAHLSGADISGPIRIDHPLTAGMGSRRRWATMVRWNSESRRRQLRTAHQVIAERRLAQPSVNKS
jgi:hypothetical protein